MKTAGKIFETSNYGLFKSLEGNRDITDQRVRKIVASIRNVGQRMCPILVNEKYEVIDGQARLEAFKKEQLPIYYIIEPGIGIEECIALNIHQKDWTIKDFIKSYADRNVLDYIYLQNLVTAYKGIFGVSIIVAAVNNNYYAYGGSYHKVIESGAFTCTTKQYEQAVDKLEFVKRFAPQSTSYCMALLFCYTVDEVDKDLLLKKIKNKRELFAVSKLTDAIEEVEEIYNYRNRSKVYLLTEFKKRQAG